MMKRGSSGLAGSILGFLWLLAAARCSACGTGPLTVTNIPTLGGSQFEAYGLNAAGQVTGFSYLPGNTSEHAFIYSNGVTTDLGTLGLNNSIGYALNDLGQVAGQANTGNEIHAALYSGGSWTDLGTLGGGFASAIAINNAGQVAGTSQRGPGLGQQAFLYNSGSMTNLGELGGDDSSANAMNQLGDVAGYSYTADGDLHGFIYTNGTMADLGTLGGNYSWAAALNDGRVVVGESSIINGDVHAFSYADGLMTDLGTLGGTYSTALAINKFNQIMGLSTGTNDVEWLGFIYQNGTLTDLGTLGGDYCNPSALNNLGQIVGDSADFFGDSHAFLWQQGTITDLNTLLPDGSGWVLNTALFINDQGRVVGTGTYNGVSQWYDLGLSAASLPPVAVAVVDQTAECHTPVTLNGTNSYASDGGALTYQWSEDGTVLSTLAIAALAFDIGTHNITLKVTDGCGGSAETNALLTVVDTTPPVIVSAPGPISISADANCRAAVPNVLSDIVASDNCTPASQLVMAQSPSAGAALGTGNSSIVVTVMDASSNVTSTNISFSVVDTTPPVIVSAPGPISLSVGANCQATVPVVLGNVLAIDNCTSAGQLVMAQSPLAGAALGLGSSSIVVTVTDASGNFSSTNIPVTVVDTTPPVVVSAPGPISLSVGANCQATVPNVLASVAATDNCTPASQLVIAQSPSVGAALALGSSSIVVTVTDASGNFSSTNILVSVADTTPPVIVSAPGPISLSAGANCQAAVPNVLGNVVATDNCTPASQLVMTQNPSAGAALGTGGTNIVVTVADASGNFTTTNIPVSVADTTAPIIVSAPGLISLSVGANCQAAVPNVLANVVATDNCTPASQLAMTQNPPAGAALGTGVTNIVVMVADASGNFTTTNIPVSVADTTAPVIVSAPGLISLSVGANCQAAVPNVLGNVVATDNCTPASQLAMTQNPPAGAALGTGGTNIVVMVADASGNFTTTNIPVSVADTTTPVIVSAPGLISLSVGANCQAAVPNILGNVVATDNCTPASQLVMTQSPLAGTALGTGSGSIVVTVRDASGNFTTTNIPVTVADTTPPVIVSAPGPILLSASANCQAAVPNVLSNVVAYDNCTPSNRLEFTQSPPAGALLMPGQYTLAVTVTDASSNSISHGVPLTVVAATPPVIQSVSASTNVLSPPNHQLVPVTVSVLASSPCGGTLASKIVSITCNEATAPGDIQITGNLTATLAATRNPSGPGRIYTITIRCTDAYGNSATGTVTVTVPKGSGK